MQHDADDALTLSNPRLLTAAYFSLLAIIITIAIDTLLYILGIDMMLPLYKSVILAVVIAGCFGALFGKLIIRSEKPYQKQAFWWAFLMVILAVPVYNLGFLLLLAGQHSTLFVDAALIHLVYLYFVALLYSYILAGLWMAILAGLAAMYLRGYLVYYLLKTIYVRRKSPHDKVIKNR